MRRLLRQPTGWADDHALVRASELWGCAWRVFWASAFVQKIQADRSVVVAAPGGGKQVLPLLLWTDTEGDGQHFDSIWPKAGLHAEFTTEETLTTGRTTVSTEPTGCLHLI
mmetsp:Transcript_71639/g.191131  ORF Transcript_71639/g.191131 Transcript_71639/m.191131 type:complete len:111 (+) Transcript_71639:140-472(+)